jgi:hypothetical protein
MKAEHLNEWLANIKWEEWEDSGVERLGDRWRLFVKLLQVVWTTGFVPIQMSWMIIILLPKDGGLYCGIGLLNRIWKVVEKVKVFWFLAIKLHGCLHGRLPGRGMGDGHHGGQAATTACMGRTGTPVQDLSGPAESL